MAEAAAGRDGIRTAEHFKPDVALIDLKLPDMSGLRVLSELRIQNPATAEVLITGFGTCRSAVEAMRLGAFDYLEKPLDLDAVLDVVKKAAANRIRRQENRLDLQPAESHSLKRWADAVVRAISSPTDPKTVREWGRSIGVSPGALRNWCRTARLPARRSLLFARVLRAVIRHTWTSSDPENLLDIVDRRTLSKLLAASGGTGARLPSNVNEFLQRQRLIDNAQAVAEIQAALTPALGDPGHVSRQVPTAAHS